MTKQVHRSNSFGTFLQQLEMQENDFIPSQLVQDLKDIGNWKVRASAIEDLQQRVVALTYDALTCSHPQVSVTMLLLAAIQCCRKLHCGLCCLGMLLAL